MIEKKKNTIDINTIKLRIIETTENVDIAFMIPQTYKMGNISAHLIDNDEWWIARAIIKPESLRGQGLGTKMLEKLKAAVIRQGCKKLIVTPGGYEGKKKKQFNFYLKNGFTNQGKDTLVWRHNG